ncbi:Transcriptional activator protein CopR [Xanthomonas hydrangeae]|nr:Transcriptional activator protein CopR [Xanthomonas hydrangeae]CAD7716587.1 Transcriptional activator protein CopR [Xanthomonas hydrangeae]CAD7732100.1 Transcriptional activator protein CopR [Xanthomonas hydrangeae]CAD7732103.1 Transcriptional activator protein CopR [Xanthomonas hydrangeae]CAD7735028.1 Transcriptional activator protein CopR [Xanthomonas hydrangeae]
MKVLIVEDQYDIAANIWDFLERRGYQVDHAGDGMSGLAHVMRDRFDVIVLDLGLPRLDGLELCRRMRQAGQGTPVLMLTARDTLEDKLRGFAEGADDYMVKPFELKELEARLRVLHRQTQSVAAREFVVGPLRFDPDAMLATREGRHITLTRAQALILGALMRRSPAIVQQQSLIECVWASQGGDAAALHTHVYALRNLVDKPFQYQLIQTVHGIGYRLIAAADG